MIKEAKYTIEMDKNPELENYIEETYSLTIKSDNSKELWEKVLEMEKVLNSKE